MNDTLQRLFRFKAWADDELLTALARLDGQSPITGLAIKALSHSYVVDRIFAAHMRRKAHGYISANLSEMPTLEDLSSDMRKSDREYIDYVSALDPDQQVQETLRPFFRVVRRTGAAWASRTVCVMPALRSLLRPSAKVRCG